MQSIKMRDEGNRSKPQDLVAYAKFGDVREITPQHLHSQNVSSKSKDQTFMTAAITNH